MFGVAMQEMKLRDEDVLSLLKDVGAAKRKVGCTAAAAAAATFTHVHL